MFIIKWLVLFVRPFVNRFPHVAAMYRGMRDQLDCMEEPQSTPWGFKLAGNAAMAQGSFEPMETELVRNLLDEVDILINVGANVGYYCCHALSMGKQVIAFEPMQRNLHYLYKNIKANGWSGVEIYPMALSDHAGILEIYGGNTGASLVKGWAGIPESYRTLVPCSTMDTVLGARLKGKQVLVLIDIEGAERWMLEGAVNMLSSNPKPIWVVEITAKENQPAGFEMNPNFKSTFEIFLRNGYQAFTADRKIRPITEEEVECVSMGQGSFETYNFLFRDSMQIS